MVATKSFEWEGKGFKYFFKYQLRHNPEMLLSFSGYLFVIPAVLYYVASTFEEKHLSFSRFRPKLIVYRDDDPRIRNIIKFDEHGNRIHLEPRK